ncbi:PIN domain-containing protein [Gordonia sp. (in: high G+C Gram-positive bacteria)]|uniref:PIN domain-containing protein n=1 Tax=unclassified Gordonia (in: high G+C Gram-positive bacteria) TaxID=2657482 RepID=UPI0035280A8D
MGATQVFVDANVIRSRTLRDWLFLLRNAGDMFSVCTTEDVIAEVVYTLRREKPDAPGYLTSSVHDRITEQLDYRVEDYPAGAPGYCGSDPDDAHVHAAAVAAGVDIVLTADKGFTSLSEEDRDGLPYEIYHPDEFFVLVDDSSPDTVRRVSGEQLEYWCAKKPSGGANLPAALDDADCPRFAERVRLRLQQL